MQQEISQQFKTGMLVRYDSVYPTANRDYPPLRELGEVTGFTRFRVAVQFPSFRRPRLYAHHNLAPVSQPAESLTWGGQ